MHEIEVPRWRIVASCVTSGLRLQPYPKLVYAPPVTSLHPKLRVLSGDYRYGKSILPTRYTEKQYLVLDDPRLEFDNAEYRFWGVDVVNNYPSVVVCRCCGSSSFAKSFRDKHNEDTGCFKKLIEAYRLLLLDMRCVMCDKQTNNTEWGVPLCKNGECIDQWCHEDYSPRALEEALNLTKTRFITGGNDDGSTL